MNKLNPNQINNIIWITVVIDDYKSPKFSNLKQQTCFISQILCVGNLYLAYLGTSGSRSVMGLYSS